MARASASASQDQEMIPPVSLLLTKGSAPALDAEIPMPTINRTEHHRIATSCRSIPGAA